MYDLQKKRPIRIKKIRDSARGKECTIQSPWCQPGPENETVVLAHYGEPGEKGQSLKPDDSSSAYACQICHDWLDGRFVPGVHIPHTRHDPVNSKEWYWFRGMRRTWRLLIENGVLE